MTDDYERLRLPKGASASLCFDVLRTAGAAPIAIGSPLNPLQACCPFVGREFTVQCKADATIGADESLIEWTKMLSATPRNSVLVIEPGDSERAYMGELSVNALIHRNCVSAVVDGPCRDTNSIRSLGFPVFCNGVTPKDVVASWRPVEFGGTVHIQGREISCRHFIVGDSDGLCVAEIDSFEVMIDGLGAALSAENKVRDAILAGADPHSAYMQYRKF